MKNIIKLLLPAFIPSLFFFVLITGFIGGGTTSVSAPIEPPVTPEKAIEYAAVCSELGINFDLVLTTDYIYADRHKEKSLEDRNPLITALEFMQIFKEVEGYKKIGEEIRYDEDDEPYTVDIYGWVTLYTDYYKGTNRISNFLDRSISEIQNFSPSQIIARVEEKRGELETELNSKISEEEDSEEEGEESNPILEYKVTLYIEPNTDIPWILTNLVGVNDKQKKDILDLYEARYLQQLYFADAFGIGFDFSRNYGELPPIIEGNVTRLELAQVAASIINHPYYWAGKSPNKGFPKGPLDCSGYIDWVYIQCFGSMISGHVSHNTGTGQQYYACDPISEDELKIGDLGFYYLPNETYTYNHVGIYIGNGQFIHAGGSSFGTKDLPNGRVGISNNGGEVNTYNPINSIDFEAMKPTNFRHFARPRFRFADD